MENKRQVSGVNSSSTSSLTMDLFGPKDSSSSPSSGLFGSVFGPQSTGLQRNASHTGPSKKQDLGNQYVNGKHGNSGNTAHNQNKSSKPCYFSSSIYYGGQEVYSPNGYTTSQHIFKKDGGDDDEYGSKSSSASRGNWWQGSLYY